MSPAEQATLSTMSTTHSRPMALIALLCAGCALVGCAGQWGSAAKPQGAPRSRTQTLRITSSVPAVVRVDGRRVGTTPVMVSLRYRARRVTRHRREMVLGGAGAIGASPFLAFLTYRRAQFESALDHHHLYSVMLGVGAVLAAASGIALLLTSPVRKREVDPGAFTIALTLPGGTRHMAKLIGPAPFAELRGLHFYLGQRRFVPNVEGKGKGWRLIQGPTNAAGTHVAPAMADGPDEPGPRGELR
jgi:uncharacterized membrane protein YbhN (UPF0104 family)